MQQERDQFEWAYQLPGTDSDLFLQAKEHCFGPIVWVVKS